MARGDQALQRDTKGMFRFNPGIQGKTVPDYNPYTISRCRSCSIPNGKTNLAAFIPENEVCRTCEILRYCVDKRKYTPDAVYGDRLLISEFADETEIVENTRAAKALLDAFPNMKIKIRGHVLGVYKFKNPEYEINGLIADRKGIESEKGIRSGFVSAIKQGSSCVVIDLDMHPKLFKVLNIGAITEGIQGRYRDFISGKIKQCYVIFDNQAVMIDDTIIFFDPNLDEKHNRWANQERVNSVLKKIRNVRRHS